MTDETKTGGGAPRRSASIDLPKSAVVDLTPKAAEAAPAEAAAQAAPQAEPARTRPAAEPPAAESKPAPEPSSPAPARPAASGGSSIPVVGGAVAGAIFGLLGAVGYQNLAAPPVTVADPIVHKLRDDTSAVNQKLRDDMAAVASKVVEARDTEQRVTQTFEQKLAALAAAQTKDVESRAAQLAKELETRAAALDQKLAAAEQRAAVAEQKGLGLEKLIAAMDQKAATLIAPVDDRLKAAEARITEGREQAGQMLKRIDLLAMIEPPRVDLRPIVTKIDELERTIGSNAARSTLTGDVAQVLDGRIKTIEQTSGTLGQSLKTVEQALKGVDQSVADLKAKPAAVDVPAALLAVAGLTRRALDNGEALGALTTTLSALGANAQQVAALSVFADKPVPKLSGLAQQAEALATAAQKAAAAKAPAPAAPASPGLLDKVTSTLLSQVEVKRVGEAAPLAPSAEGTRIKSLLQAGDGTGALAALNALPADQRETFKPVIEALAARAAAYDGLRAIEQGALAAVARKG